MVHRLRLLLKIRDEHCYIRCINREHRTLFCLSLTSHILLLLVEVCYITENFTDDMLPVVIRILSFFIDSENINYKNTIGISCQCPRLELLTVQCLSVRAGLLHCVELLTFCPCSYYVYSNMLNHHCFPLSFGG